MTSRTSVAGLLAGLVLCCSLSTSPVRGSEPTIQVVPAVRHVAAADDDSPTVTTVGWRHFARRAYRRSHFGWGPGIRRYGFYRSYPGYYYGGYAPYAYSAPVYRTTYYAPTYVAPIRYAPTYYTPSYYAPSPAYYAPSYTVRYAPSLFSYRPLFYNTPSVRVLYGGYGYYYPGYY